MKNARRINNLLGGLVPAAKAQAILLFTPKGNGKKRKQHFKPLKLN